VEPPKAGFDVGERSLPNEAKALLLFFVCIVEFAVIGVLCAHHYCDVSWTLLGKVAVYAGIPGIMAYLGNHLAAESVVSKTEKLFWRILFIGLAIVGIVSSLFLEIQLEKEHNAEQSKLISDVSSNVTNSWVQYNKEHPQNPLTFKQFSDWWKLYNENLPKSIVKYQSTPPAAVPVLLPAAPAPSSSSVPYRAPVILSAPKIFSDGGTITGRDLGNTRRELIMRFRVKPSAMTGNYGPDGLVGPDLLLGNNRALNEIHLDVPIIQKWTDTSIDLRFPAGYWQKYMDQITSKAQSRNVLPPNHDDIEIQYRVSEPDGPFSGWFPK
jgi:hypothetical protein